MNTNVVHTGDCFDVLSTLPDESIHAVVTDPPYGLAFMGRDWDDFEPKEYQEWCEQWATDVKRVLKPGGHLLAFSGNRTHHRLFVGVEDAGFEVRDTLTWHYGSGFPKAADVSKVIDKRADAEREVVGQYEHPDGVDRDWDGHDKEGEVYREERGGDEKRRITKPATDAAKQWDGFKTGLKPATEFVVMARNPFDGATVDCVLEHGTGALNIDGTRIPTDESWEGSEMPHLDAGNSYEDRPSDGNGVEGLNQQSSGSHENGRYPANVVFGEQAADALDAKNKHTKSTVRHDGKRESGNSMGGGELPERTGGANDSGGPSRYFYTSKATKAERTLDGRIDNAHPTVKPADLMEWLVTLVTAEGQIVLDPFAGSGTTLRAAKDKGRQFVGVERQPKWADVARVRAGLTPNDPSHVRDTDDAQSGLEAYE
jgi:site-specific DNA-methyltransferase (adenine-specific)